MFYRIIFICGLLMFSGVAFSSSTTYSSKDGGKKYRLISSNDKTRRSQSKVRSQSKSRPKVLDDSSMVAAKPKTKNKNKSGSNSSIYTIQSKLKKIEFLEIDFVQKIYTPLRNKTRIIEGKAFFAYPNKFKWIRSKPVKEQITYDGSILSIYKPEEKTAVVLNSVSVQNQEIENITDMILDTSTLLDKYKVIESSLDDKIVFLKLYPKEEGTNISEINLTVDLSKNYVDTLKIYYVDKKTWEFDFSNPKTKQLPVSFFKFKAPAGVSVSKE